MPDMKKIQVLREKTGLGVMDLKKALDEADGDEAKALKALQEKGVSIAHKRSDRATGQGIVTAYVHGSRIGALVELNCETDFVAITDDFRTLGKELAMQVASMAPESIEALLEQAFIKDPDKTIQDLITEIIAKTGENIRVGNISRLGLGESTQGTD